jgi:hypothetical protein
MRVQITCPAQLIAFGMHFPGNLRPVSQAMMEWLLEESQIWGEAATNVWENKKWY